MYIYICCHNTSGVRGVAQLQRIPYSHSVRASPTEMCSGSEEGSYVRLIDVCMTRRACGAWRSSSTSPTRTRSAPSPDTRSTRNW